MYQPSDLSELAERSSTLRQSISDCLENIANPWVRAGIQAGLKDDIDEHLGKTTANLSDTGISLQAYEPQETRRIRGFSSKPREKDPEVAVSYESGRAMRVKKFRHADKDVLTSIYRTLFGSVYLSTQEASVEILWGSDTELDSASGREQASTERRRELATKITFIPSMWVCKTFLQYGLEFSMRGGSQWKYGFRTFHSVADDARIFDFCREGNIDAVKTLLKRGEASPWDTDSQGWTPLHVSKHDCRTPNRSLLS
jgi:hypothetical protein